MSFSLASSAFQDHQEMPGLYTCDGRDISPPLAWSGLPDGTKSLALIVDDPDAPDPAAPKMTWVHWILYNLPPDTNGLPQGIAAHDLPSGTLGGRNDWNRAAYGGPCPPIGRHRYIHTLYALDMMLPDLDLPTKAKLEIALQGHVLAQAQLTGLYQRQ